MTRIIYIVTGLLTIIACSGKTDATCAARYQIITDHTACKPASADVMATGVSESEKTAIVDTHNDYRAGVSPTATDMLKLVWDDDLALVAQAHAETCVWGHDSGYARRIPGRYSAGQNLAANAPTKDWTGRVDSWYNEVSDFVYGTEPSGSVVVGHYTQMVWATTHKIGCGYAKCSQFLSGGTLDGHHYVCNYGPAGNIGSVAEPYTSGTACAACPTSCVNNLCNCPSSECLNGQTFDIDQCTCACSATYYVQDNCALNCTDIGTQSCYWPASDCPTYVNVPDSCPVTCGFCPDGDSTTTTTGGGGGGGGGGGAHLQPMLLLALLPVFLSFVN